MNGKTNNGLLSLFSLVLFLFLSLSLLPNARSQELADYKKNGQVGERLDGYIGAVAPAPAADVQKFVDKINKERRDVYLDISKGNGQSIEVVEKLAAEKIKEKIKEGEFYLNEKGEWVKK